MPAKHPLAGVLALQTAPGARGRNGRWYSTLPPDVQQRCATWILAQGDLRDATKTRPGLQIIEQSELSRSDMLLPVKPLPLGFPLSAPRLNLLA